MKRVVSIIKKIFSKTVYLIEFVISIILVGCIIDFALIKIYEGYYGMNRTIAITVLSILLLGIIVYGIRKYKGIAEKLFLLFAIPVGIGYAFIMMPQTVPDEGSHILKAYDISVGHFITKVDKEGNSSATIIQELENFSYLRFSNYVTLKKDLQKQTDYTAQEEVVCPVQGNSPLLYIGTASALWIGRLMHLNVFAAVFIGRICNLVIFLALGYLAIKKIPFGKALLSVYLCVPMMLQQAASFSGDAVLNATLIYYIAYLIALVFQKSTTTKKDIIILYMLTVFVAMFKYIYILVAGILLIKWFREKENRKTNAKIICGMVIVGIIFGVGWFIISSLAKSVPPVFADYYRSSNVNATEQIAYIKGNFIQFIKTIIQEFCKCGMYYVLEAIGSRLGWLSINTNMGVIVIYLIILLYACITENTQLEFSNKEKWWIWLIIFTIALLLFAIMYVTFTPVGLNRIAGIQGRYFTAILLMGFLCLIKKENYWKVKNPNEKIAIISFILNICTLITVFVFYI